MSYAGFTGYSCPAPSQLALMGQHHPGPGAPGATNSPPGLSCCSAVPGNDAPLGGQPASGINGTSTSGETSPHHLQTSPATSASSTPTVCGIPSYDSRLITSTYPRLGGFYGSSPYSEQTNYMTAFGSSAPSFYPTLTHPYDLKETNGSTWSSIPQTTCYPYDGSLYNPYGDRYTGMDSAARRKNATRETTNTLKAWLYEHRKNPYPTKGEKIMLAIITKMTLTQVSTWFANARRRLKKENKMTWEPRNKTSDGQDTDDKDSCNGSDNEDNSSSGGIGDTSLVTPSGTLVANRLTSGQVSPGLGVKTESPVEATNLSQKQAGAPLVPSLPSSMINVKSGHHSNEKSSFEGSAENNPTTRLDSLRNGHHHHHHHQNQNQNQHRAEDESKIEPGPAQLLSPHHIKHGSSAGRVTPNHGQDPSGGGPVGGQMEANSNHDNLSQRPKIWSLAQTATSDGPPYRAPLPPNEWHLNVALSGLPAGPEAALSDYQSRHPECPPGLSTGSLRRVGSAQWVDDPNGPCLAASARSGLSLLSSSGPIAVASNYPLHQKGTLSSRAASTTFATSFSNSTMSHLGSGANENFSTYPPPPPPASALNHPNPGSINGIRPIPDSRSGHMASSEGSLSPTENGLYTDPNSAPNAEMLSSSTSSLRTNTFLGRVFSDYISSGPGIELNHENSSDRGGGFSEDGSSSSSSTHHQEPVKRSSSEMTTSGANSLYGNGNGAGISGSAFRPMSKR